MFSPSDLEQLQQQSLPIYDTAIRWLARSVHPQQRRQLLHSHQQKLNQFIQDSNAQWDSGYAVNRYSQYRALQNIFPTPELQQNISAAKREDGGNLPLHRNGNGGQNGVIAGDELSINDLQFHLSNQAATLRMNMTSEYEDMRIFQNSELEVLLKAKAKKEPEFSKLIEEVRLHLNRPPRPPPLRMVSQRSNSTSTTHSPVIQQIASPILSHSPAPLPDLHQLKNDPSLSPFIKFFLQLQVVQQNWLAISSNWGHYVVIFQRGLMTEKAFAKAILEDAVRINHNNIKFTVELNHIQTTRQMATSFPETMAMSRLITDVVLEMAEAGDIEFTEAPNEEMGETFGPKILMDVIDLESDSSHVQQQQTREVSRGVGRATDPR